jgi:hypothetical protein
LVFDLKNAAFKGLIHLFSSKCFTMAILIVSN